MKSTSPPAYVLGALFTLLSIPFQNKDAWTSVHKRTLNKGEQLGGEWTSNFPWVDMEWGITKHGQHFHQACVTCGSSKQGYVFSPYGVIWESNSMLECCRICDPAFHQVGQHPAAMLNHPSMIQRHGLGLLWVSTCLILHKPHNVRSGLCKGTITHCSKIPINPYLGLHTIYPIVYHSEEIWKVK